MTPDEFNGPFSKTIGRAMGELRRARLVRERGVFGLLGIYVRDLWRAFLDGFRKGWRR